MGPALLAAFMALWKIWVPSLWRDESVTAHFARVPLRQAWSEWGEYDAVHALHYLLVRLTIWIEPLELGLRLPSVIAFVAATVGIVLIGRRLDSWLVGACAATVYAIVPVASRYAQEGRSYPLVCAAAVFATLALLRLIERPTWQRTTVYGLMVALVGYLHLYGLLLLVAHGAWIVVGGRPALRRVVVAWAGAAIALAPLVLVAAGQRERQLYWITTPGAEEFRKLVELFGVTKELTAFLVLLVLVGAWALRRASLPLMWAVLPLIASIAISQFHPVFTDRYVLFVVPALALLVGAGIVWIARAVSRGRRFVLAATIVAALGVIAVLGLPRQQAYRGHMHGPENLRALTQELAASSRDGDVLMPLSARFLPFANAYGGPFDELDVVTVDTVPADVDRIWIVNLGVPHIERYAELQQLSRTFEMDRRMPFGSTNLSLWTRKASGS